MELSDPDLMVRIRTGDNRAFHELFERWKRPLLSFFLRSIGDFHTAEDLTLQVAERVYKARDRYERKAKFSTWLFQIARNALIDHHRRQNSRPRLQEFPPERNWSYPDPSIGENAGDLQEWEDWLTATLRDFPEKERTALLLVAQQGMKPAEGAEIMNITANHFRVLLNRARDQLRQRREDPS